MKAISEFKRPLIVLLSVFAITQSAFSAEDVSEDSQPARTSVLGEKKDGTTCEFKTTKTSKTGEAAGPIVEPSSPPASTTVIGN